MWYFGLVFFEPTQNFDCGNFEINRSRLRILQTTIPTPGHL